MTPGKEINTNVFNISTENKDQNLRMDNRGMEDTGDRIELVGEGEESQIVQKVKGLTL